MRGLILASCLLWATAIASAVIPSSAKAQAAPTTTAIRYSGGDGLTLKKAVVITGAASVSEGLAAEAQWIRLHYSDATIESRGRVVGPPHYDVITVKLASGSRLDVHFDISGFFVE